MFFFKKGVARGFLWLALRLQIGIVRVRGVAGFLCSSKFALLPGNETTKLIRRQKCFFCMGFPVFGLINNTKIYSSAGSCLHG